MLLFWQSVPVHPFSGIIICPYQSSKKVREGERVEKIAIRV
jgi:hypothetical protein